MVTVSGYQAAVLSQLAGNVISIERHAELSRRAGAVPEELGCENVRLVIGDGSLGGTAEAPYDRIIVTAAADRVPQPLLDQLREGGVLVMPVGPSESQMLTAVRKLGEGLQALDLCPCRFVPLLGAGTDGEPPEAGSSV